MVDEGNKNEILCVSFNQDQGCFACGTQHGFKIFNTHPYKDTFQRDFDGGIGIVEMLFRCNILALVGGGKHPKYPTNKVILWDDHQMKCIGELSFKSNVKAVKLRKDKVVVVLEQRIYVYQFSDLKLLDAIETSPNPKGLCALSANPKNNCLLVCPDKTKGNIRIKNYDTSHVVVKKAHESGLAFICLNNDGTLVATASDKGTLIRIFKTGDGAHLTEFRRGADKAEIFCITFDKLSNWLACTSDKGTIHVYSVKKQPGEAALDTDTEKTYQPKGTAQNPKSMLGFLKKVGISYFDSEWSVSQFRIPDSRAVVAFGPEDQNYLIAVSMEGNYYLAEYDPQNGGECKKLTERRLLMGFD